MANGKRGEVEIFIGSETRRLKFDFNALCELEDLFKKPIGEIFAEGAAGMKVVRDSIFVGLKSSTPNLTPEQVGHWMGQDMERLEEWTTALTQSLFGALGKAADAGAEAAATGEDP